MKIIELNKKQKIVIIDVFTKDASSIIAPWSEVFIGKLVEQVGFFKKQQRSSYVVGIVEAFTLDDILVMTSLQECLWFKESFEDVAENLNKFEAEILKRKLVGKRTFLLERELGILKAKAAQLREKLREIAL